MMSIFFVIVRRRAMLRVVIIYLHQRLKQESILEGSGSDPGKGGLTKNYLVGAYGRVCITFIDVTQAQ